MKLLNNLINFQKYLHLYTLSILTVLQNHLARNICNFEFDKGQRHAIGY